MATSNATGLLGVNLTSAISSAKWVKETGHNVGQVVIADDGTMWLAVTAAAAITAFDCVAVDEDFEASPATPALITDGHRPAFAQYGFSANDYGWVALNGSNISVRVKGNATADTELWTTGSAGILDDGSASGQLKIKGVTAVAAAGGNSAGDTKSVEVLAVFPHVEEVGRV